MTTGQQEKLQPWRRCVGLAFAWVALCACESRYSPTPANAPEMVASDASSNAVEALLAFMHPDAGHDDAQVLLDVSHAMILSTCTSNPKPCSDSVGDAAPSGQYFVVFGSGRGVVRSRDQALTDLYEELRNRIEAGERLDVRSARSSDTAPSGREHGQAQPSMATSEGKGETASHCALRLLGIADEVGQLTLDVVHGKGDGGCLVTLDVSRCLIQAPEKPHRPGGKGGFSF
jgi:hypothetical protein